MKTRARLATLLAAGSLFLAGAFSQATANSAMTDRFVARVRPNVDYLDRSSRMALDKTRNPSVRAFAHRQAVEQTIAANSLVAWTQANTLAGTAVALGTPIVPGVMEAPAEAAGEMMTGRSASDGRPLTVTRTPHDAAPPATDEELTRLHALSGRDFDIRYLDTQRASLSQLSAVYADYARSGNDAGLRAMAIRELPKIKRRLAELPRL